MFSPSELDDGLLADYYPGEEEIYNNRTEEEKDKLRKKLEEIINQKPLPYKLSDAFPGVKVTSVEELRKLKKKHEESNEQ